MKYIPLFISLVISSGANGLTIIPPKKIPYLEAHKYGIKISRKVDVDKSVIFMDVNEREFCPVESVELIEKFDTIGEETRYLHWGDKGYSAVFSNYAEYSFIGFKIICEKFPPQFDSRVFMVLIKE